MKVETKNLRIRTNDAGMRTENKINAATGKLSQSNKKAYQQYENGDVCGIGFHELYRNYN